MNELGKAFGGMSGNALRGAVRRDEFGMLRFQPAQLLHQRIVFAIGDLRTLLQIVEIIVPTNLVTQLLDLLFPRSCRQDASGRIKEISRPSIVALKCATRQT